MQQQQNSIFLTIEGIEGVGKSTAVQFIQQYLTQAKKKFILTREPGGTPIAEQIRQILLFPSTDETMQAETELLLMFAARIQHIKTVILPALEADNWVISDRFVDASFAYQGGGRGIATAHIEMLSHWLVNTLRPNLTILLDAPPHIGLARAKHRAPQDRIEAETLEFFSRVRESYLSRARQDENRFRIIDATRELSEVQTELKKILDELLSNAAA